MTKERPIIFSGPMVQAILDGRKTQTRRVMKQQPQGELWPADFSAPGLLAWQSMNAAGQIIDHACPHGQAGDRLWVRETWATSVGVDDQKPSVLDTPGKGYGWPVWFASDGSVWWRGAKAGGPGFVDRGRWRPSIHMPRWASRITLEVTGVRVERLQDISEGVTLRGTSRYEGQSRDAYADLWDSLNTKRGFGWDTNPWVWAIEFKRVD